MNTPAHFGRLARIYSWMEYFSFGPYLRRCRDLRLSEMMGRQRALVYGDGDGRFLAELVRRSPGLQVVAVDASQGMLARAARRLPRHARVRLVHADALALQPAKFVEGSIDLIVSHFFLDCFDEQDVAILVGHVNAAASKSAMWVISDFAIPQRPVARLLSRLIVRGLYLAFRLLTGLTTRRLPDYASVMRAGGWVLEDRGELLRGLLVSERWRRSRAS
jgi:SAM-dependent methyltransferase